MNRSHRVVLSLTGEAFDTGKDVLSADATRVMKELAAAIRKSPTETILIEGHTDSVGTAAANRELSLRRARAAANYLIEQEGVPDSCLAVAGAGEDRPVASNATAEGRARNRRVEVKREATEVLRASLTRAGTSTPEVRIDGQPVPVGQEGVFRTTYPDSGGERLAIALQGRQGEAVSTSLALPSLEIEAPDGETRVPHGADGGGWRVTTAEASLIAAASVTQDAAPPSDSPLVVECPLRGRTDPDGSLLVNGQPLTIAPDGTFATTLRLALGANIFGLVAQGASGGTRLANLMVTVNDHEETGELVVVVEAQPDLDVALPPLGTTLTNTQLIVEGRTAPGNRVTVNGVEAAVAPDGSFRAMATLPEGQSKVEVKATDPAGRASTVQREYTVAPRQLFFLAFADGVVGRLTGEGVLEGATTHDEAGYYTEGRLAFYLKGWVAGRYLVTSAYDSQVREFADLFASVDRGTSDRLLTRLDPDRLYPVYGDSCTVVYDAQSQGRFYLAVQSEDLNLTVGNTPLDFTDADLAAYRRTLYGGHAEYRSVARTRRGEPTTSITLLGAELGQEHVRDELRGTGGSLYYLSQQKLIEGSEQVALVIRDQNTGLEVARIPQRYQLDYTVKYEEGRLLFNRPIASVVDGTMLVSTDILPGNPVFIEVEYERRLQALDNTLVGARASRYVGDNVRVGGTYVHDDLDAAPYELSGAEADVRLGEGTRLSAEVANSTGGGTQVSRSADGGLTWSRTAASPTAEGQAWKAAVTIDVGEALGLSTRLRTYGYARRLYPGFYSGVSLADLSTEKQGLGAELDLGGAGVFGVKHDRQRQLGRGLFGGATPGRSDLTSATWRRTWGAWDLAAEYQGQAVRDSAGTTVRSSDAVAARATARLRSNLTAGLTYQANLSGATADRTTLGLRYQPLRKLALEAEGMLGTQGRSLRGGALYNLGRGNLYLREQVLEQGLERRTTSVVGGEMPLGAGSRVYSERQQESTAAGVTGLSVLGVEQLWQLGPGLQLLVAGEHGRKDGATVTGERSALSAGLTYVKPRAFQVRTRQEFRFETGGQRREQILTENQIQARLGRGFSGSALYRHSVSRNTTLGTTDAQFTEASLGLAYRPPTDDRVNLLARVTRLHDQRPAVAGGTAPAQTELDVAAIEGSFRLTPWLEFVGKDAVRYLRQSSALGLGPQTRSMLVIGRTNWRVFGPWQLGAEYRLLTQREAADQRQGLAGELMWDFERHLRFGGGYNFSRISDNEFSTSDRSLRGWFLRIQGRY